MIKISYRTEVDVSEKELVNSVSHWLKYKTPYSVFDRYKYKYKSRLQELIMSHYLNYPHTRLTCKKETADDAKKVIKHFRDQRIKGVG